MLFNGYLTRTKRLLILIGKLEVTSNMCKIQKIQSYFVNMFCIWKKKKVRH